MVVSCVCPAAFGLDRVPVGLSTLHDPGCRRYEYGDGGMMALYRERPREAQRGAGAAEREIEAE